MQSTCQSRRQGRGWGRKIKLMVILTLHMFPHETSLNSKINYLGFISITLSGFQIDRITLKQLQIHTEKTRAYEEWWCWFSHQAMSDSRDPMDCSLLSPLSMGFPRQEYWGGLPFPSAGDLPNPGIELGSPALQADCLLLEPTGKPLITKLAKGLSFHLTPCSLTAVPHYSKHYLLS